MSSQTSIISYVPQPYFVAGSDALATYTAISSIENEDGIFDPDLSNYTTIVPNASASVFAIQVDFGKQSAHLSNFNMTLGLIGCALLTYEDDGYGSPDLDTEFSENIDCTAAGNVGQESNELSSFAHNSQDTVHTFDRTALPSVISGGRANLIFNGLGYSTSGATATTIFTITRLAADVAARPHARLIIGHLFVGVDLVVTIDPLTFTWTLEINNQRFAARDFGAINSDGTLVKRSTGEFIKIVNNALIGSVVTAVSPATAVTPQANYFDLTKVNTSYPLLFNPYPASTILTSSLTVERANLAARQNFFSIYGFMDDPLELLCGEYRDGLSSEYKARYRITETR